MKTRTKMIWVLTSLMVGALLLQACGESTSTSDSANTTPSSKAETAGPTAPANAYAPMLVAPKKLPDDPGAPMLVMMMKNTVIPSASDVNIPVYPGAKIMTAMGPMNMSSNGEKTTTYPSMSMLSGDETTEVLAFYQEELAGWKYHDFFGSHSFWNGGEDSNPLDFTGQFSLVSIVPVSETDSVRAIWPETRTRIDIRYEPPVP